ncbi:MAG TPA: PKD domain-containing protein [Ktedonobacterales bacterium]|jgi:PKD repeat protein
MPEQVYPAWRRLFAPLLSIALILSISSILALTLALGAPMLLGNTPLARACGLANTPTMIANTDPAIPTPITPGSDPNQPVGFFPGAYYRAQSIAFTEDLSSVPNAPTKSSIQFRWDFGDGSSFASGAEPKHTFQRAGAFAIRVTTYDSVTKSWVDFDSATITVLAQPFSTPPIAKATADKSLVAINDTVTFDASGSKALVGSTLSYEWNFGDATPDGLGPRVTHAFTIPGRALVTLIVTDSRSAESTAVVPVTVAVSIPQVHLQVSTTTARPGQTIAFDASQVQVNAGDAITKYIWDFGDQTPKQTTTAGTTTHSYAKVGQYHMQVQAIDLQDIPGTATAVLTIQTAQSNETGKGSSVSFTLIGLGLLIVLAIGGLFITAIWRRRPAPAVQGRRTAGRGAAQRQRAAGRKPPTGRRPQPGRPSPDPRPSMTAPAQRSERPMPDQDGDSPDRFLRD